ncbi:hypothetical protein [Sphingosinicella sp. BN140058]|uniref:hypothetical protein n=1 Tax=Sphingosinicella sp. BN140058 TaxID=1892855 RepID=UPI001012D134|nr:hypothetical protein [Sphingosinicella sp. BN140058]QAY80254.1 hypothetical protein ETR14_26790 [Sphingosinicella sp. BN140058]
MDSSQINTPFNESRYPVLDRKGRPFTPGCRIRYVLPSYYINTKAGTGTISKIDRYGGVYYEADKPEQVLDRCGACRDVRTAQYATVGDYQSSGQFAGSWLTVGTLGDPHEHGETDVFIEVVD